MTEKNPPLGLLVRFSVVFFVFWTVREAILTSQRKKKQEVINCARNQGLSSTGTIFASETKQSIYFNAVTILLRVYLLVITPATKSVPKR